MKKLSTYLSTASLAVGLFLINPATVLAQDTKNTIDLNATGQWSKVSKLEPGTLVSGGIRLMLLLAALLFFFMLVIGGIQWIISGGDKAKSEEARKRITSALVGLAIVFAAWAIVALVNTLFGINIMTLSIPELYNTK